MPPYHTLAGIFVVIYWMFLLEIAFSSLSTLQHTWFEFLVQLESAHHNREGITTTIGSMDLSDLHCVVCKVIVDGNGSGVLLQTISVIPQSEETQHLNREKLRD